MQQGLKVCCTKQSVGVAGTAGPSPSDAKQFHTWLIAQIDIQS